MFDTGVAWLRGAVPLPSACTPAELIDGMVALHRVESVLAERKLALIAELAGRRAMEHGDPEGWYSSGVELAESEVGAALTVAHQHAGSLIDLGTALRQRLSGTRAAMARGELDLFRAKLIESATRNVGEELIAEVERECLEQILAPPTPGGTGLTGRRLTNVVNRIVNRIDPAGVRERRRQARNHRHIGISAAEDAMMQVFGRLPAEDGRKFDSRLRELANTACPHDGRTFEQRKADAISALVDGLSVLPCICGREDCARTQRETTAARKPLVHVIVLSSTLDGDDEEPGYLDGYGIVDADHVRRIAAEADIEYVRVPDDVQAQRTVDDAPSPEVRVAAGDAVPPGAVHTYRPSAVLDVWIRVLGGMCQWLHCDTPAWSTDLDHDTPFNHRDPEQGGPTAARHMKPYCRPHHRLKHSEVWCERHNADRSIDLVAPTGHQYRARSSGYLDLLGIDAKDIVDPAELSPTSRRTRAQNRAARIRAERRQRQAAIDLSRMRKSPPIVYLRRGASTGPSSGEDDEPCPF